MILSGIFWLLWSVIVSRFFGPYGYGIFNTTYSLFSFAWSFIFGGIFQGLIKYGSEYLVNNKGDLSSFFATSLRYLTFLGIALFILLFLFSLYVKDPSWRITVFTIALSFLFSGAKDALASIIGALHQSDHLSLINASRSIVVLSSGLIFIFLSLPARFLPLLIVISSIWELLLSIYFVRSRLNKILSFDFMSLVSIARSGIKGAMSNFFQIFVFGFYISLSITAFNIMKSLDIIVLKLFFDYDAVGIYSVADTASSILFYMTSFSIPIISTISGSFAKNDRDQLERDIEIAVKYPILIGIPLTCVLIFLARPLVMGIYGPAFSRAIYPLQILTVGTFLLMFGYNLSYILVGIGKSWLAGSLMLLAALQYIISMFVLIPLYGFEGAALSLTLTGFTSLLLIPYFIWKHLNVSIYSELYRTIVSTGILSILLYLVPENNFIIIIFGIVTSVLAFIISNYLVGYITKEDIRIFKKIFSKAKG
jgi:stage V sporulation protein B